MAEKKPRNRRPPSDKIKPGTPHPTKAYTVRGYDGRWISRKAFNASKRARAAAEKGSALVKRTTSAITKTTRAALAKAPKGEIIKIKSTDSAIVKAAKRAYNLGKRTRSVVNTIYEAGKNTRKNVDSVYKAGQDARQIHDKVVKGGKDLVKGAYEGGKDTKRAVNRLKAGGKIVKSESGEITRYKKPRSGKLTKYKSKGSSLTKYDEGGKLVKTPKKSVPKTSNTRKLTPSQLKKKAWQGRTVKSDTAFNRRWKVKGSQTNPYIGKGTNEQKLLKARTEKLNSGKDTPKPKTKVKTRSSGKYGKSIIPSEGQVKWGKKFTENVRNKPWTKAKQLSRVNLSKLGRTKGVKALNQILKTAGKNKIVSGGSKLAGKTTLPLLLWEGVQQGKEVFNPKDNIVHDLRNLGSATKHWVGRKKGVDTFQRTKLSGQSPTTKLHNERRSKLLAKDDAKAKYDKSKKGTNVKDLFKKRDHNPDNLTGGGNAGRSTNSGGTSGNNQKVTIKKKQESKSNTNESKSKSNTSYWESPRFYDKNKKKRKGETPKTKKKGVWSKVWNAVKPGTSLRQVESLERRARTAKYHEKKKLLRRAKKQRAWLKKKGRL